MVWQKPLKNYCIYAIKCPDTNGIKYVGLTTNGITRLYGHWRDFKPNKDGKIIRIKAWIKKLNISPETVFRLLKSGKTSKNGVRLFYVR